MTIIANVISSAQKLFKDGATLDEVLTLIGDLGNIFGVPLKNVIRDTNGIINFFEGIFDDDTPTDMWGAFKTGVNGDEYTQKARAESEFSNGNSAGVRKAVADMVKAKTDSGKTEKEAKSAVRSSFSSTYKEMYVKAYNKGDIDEMNRIRRFLYSTGLYSSLTELDTKLAGWRKSK